jgi:hypothetical protein
MKQLLFTLVFVSVACGSVIGDFAPFKVGSVWKYSYIYYETYMGDFGQSDSLSIEINLQSIQIMDKDTLILLDVKEQGRSISAFQGVQIHDTTGSIRFIDTVIITGDSIYKSSKYRCKVFPFWNAHDVDSMDLNKGSSGVDTLYYLSTPYVMAGHGYIYLQNVGLYLYNSSWGGHRYVSTKIKLVSYNDKMISLDTKHSGKYSQMFNITNPKSYSLLSFTHKTIAQSAFSLTGKKVHIEDNLPTGIIITKGSEPVKKNR